MKADPSSLDKIYGSRFSETDPACLQWRRQLWEVLVDDFLAKWILPDATVVDYGCGLGEFINAVKATRRVAVDMRDSVRAHLDPGVEFVNADSNWLSFVGEGGADVVFCSNLLEHLPDRKAVTQLLRQFNRALSPRGRALILGPNLRYSGPKYWDFFDHVIPLTHLSLAEALASAGLETEVLIPKFLPFTTVGARRWPAFFLRCYLRLPIVWKLMGAQFFAVARASKPAGES